MVQLHLFLLFVAPCISEATAERFVKRKVSLVNQNLTAIDRPVSGELECSLLCQQKGCKMFKHVDSTCSIGMLPTIDRSTENPIATEVFIVAGCTAPPHPENGKFTCHFGVVKERCFLQCDPGYVHKSVLGTYCEKKGNKMQWDRNLNNFKCVPSVAILIGGYLTPLESSVKVFTGDKWHVLPNFNKPNYFYNSVSYFRSKIYSLKGSNSIEYDIVSGTGISVGNVFYSYQRAEQAHAIVQDQLALIGGYLAYNAETYELLPERGDFKGHRQFLLSQTARGSCACRLTDRSFMVFGGVGTIQQYSAIEYNIEDGSSIVHSSLLWGRIYCGCTLFKENNETYLLVAGGESSDQTEIFQVSTRQWLSAANGRMNYLRRTVRIVHITAGIFAIGGMTAGAIPVNQVERFIISNYTWQTTNFIPPSSIMMGGFAEVPAELFNLEN